MHTRPKDERETNAWKLWNVRFVVRVKNKFLINEQDMEERGMYTTGDPEMDAAYMEDFTDKTLTSVELMEVYKRGGGFTFCVPDQCVRVYNLLVGHIDDHMKIMASPNNQYMRKYEEQQELIEGLREMDAFAGHLYDKQARFYMKKGVRRSPLEEMLAKNSPWKKKKTEVDTSHIKEAHHPLTAILNKPIR